MEIEIDSFDASKYQVEFPFFFEADADNHIPILGRDSVIQRINNLIIERLNWQKFMPIIISTSRGMGKSFLLKMFGRQKLEAHLLSTDICQAVSCGRILSFDFAKEATAIQSVEDVQSFFPRLMIFFLCRMFQGTEVDGIHFEEIKSFSNVINYSGKQSTFNLWIAEWKQSSAERMMDEYIRLTNIAFGKNYMFPPVFLLDEIQRLCVSTEIISSYAPDGPKNHSLLSLLLTELAGKHRPICICTGTNNGNIISITEYSSIIPKIFSLTPLTKEYVEYWEYMTAFRNSSDGIQIDYGDADLVNSLVYASYQIPRLLFVAHQVWYDLRKKSTKNREYYMQKFEEEAITYYGEMCRLLTNGEFSTSDIAHIILCCGVHYSVDDIYSNVPGTNVKWNQLIQSSLIFPYLDNCYVFPFTLVWSDRADNTPTTRRTFNDKKSEIEDLASRLVENLDVKSLFVSYDEICSMDLYHIGIFYESLFVESLAVKYYITTIITGSDFQPFSKLYDADGEDISRLSDYEVNLKEGIDFPDTEKFTTDLSLPSAVIHNKHHHNAHHDMLIPVKARNGKRINIAVSVKASFNLSTDRTIQTQRLSSKSPKSTPVTILIWLYLGDVDRETRYENVVFMNGSGCCNGLAIDQFVLLKKLKSSNNK